MRRFQCGPARWHVFDRGVRRLELFRDEADYNTFLNILRFSLQASGCELWAYALMSNHYHLLLFGSSLQISRCMYQVNRIYARYHNKRHLLGGHVFDGPYQAVRIPTWGMTLWTAAYIYLNPVKAGLSTLESYPWSGYRSFLGLEGSPLEVDVQPMMKRIDLPLNRAWERFHACVQRQMSRPAPSTTGRPSMTEVHLSQFEWLLDQADAMAPGMATEDRRLLAALWGRQCGITPRVMAKVLEIHDAAAMRRALHRFKKRLMEDPSWTRLSAVP